MSVVGSLEDLSFPDILQIVHVSRQSGTLVLSGPHGERRVRFHDGRVCGATLGAGGPELEDLLLQKGLVAPAALPPARDRQVRTGEPLSTVLVAQGSVSQETIERVVREELRTILRSLVLLQEGEFRFDLEEEAPASGAEIGLREGLEPATILGDLPPAGAYREPQAGEAERPRRALLVVERSFLRFALRDDLLQHRWDVNCCSTPAVGLDLARSLVARGVPFVLVCDLLLPDGTGAGWRGGLDLVRELRALRPGLKALLIGELRDPRLRAEAIEGGATGYLPLPDLGSVGLPEVGETLGRFCAEVRRTLRRPGLLRADEREGAGPIRVADPLSLLRGLIGEMRLEEEAEIPLLILRLAAEYFERGILFMVRDDEAQGAGGFGSETRDGGSRGLDSRVRGAVLQILPGSVLARAVDSGESLVGTIPPTPENAALLDTLGSPAPAEAAVLPLSSNRRIIGILYGDNTTSGRPPGDLKALEIFLSQAGFALENAFLKRRIESLAQVTSEAAAGDRSRMAGAV